MKVITKDKGPDVVVMKTKATPNDEKTAYKWWLARKEDELGKQLIATAAFLKDSQNYRYRQAAVFAKLYGNMSLYNFGGSKIPPMSSSNALPPDRPTFNLIQSAVDTLISRISQSKPSPVFLTDNGNYRQRTLAKQLNQFIAGEFYQTKAYEKAALILRDALVEGTGVGQIYETTDKKIGLERVLLTELLVDTNEAMYGDPRQMYRFKLVDRDLLAEMAPKFKNIIMKAETAQPDNSKDSSRSIADQVMVVEGWRLPSGKDTGDGRHVIATSAGVILDEVWEKEKFPFVFMHYTERLLGFWSQGLAEQLMGTQLEINSLLFTISKAIKLVGVPRVFVEEGSKVSSTSFNNEVGAIIKYRGIKPEYMVAPAVPQEMYAQLDRLIERGYQQSGVSALQAAAQKPQGLNSGAAIRSYDDISSDRFASLQIKYKNFFIDLAYQMLDLAMDIADRDGTYSTVYPSKDGTKEVDLPKMKEMKNPFVIQCFDQSSLPREPAGRMQKVAEMIQSGMITIKEGRRLLDFPDLNQMEKLANASEERIFKILDDIIEDGKYTPPDPFMDLQLATEFVTQYYNLYSASGLEEEKQEMLRTFHSQVLALVQASQPQPAAPGPVPQAEAAPLPVSDLVPNAVGV